MDLTLSSIKTHCRGCLQRCKSFVLANKVEIITYVANTFVSHPFIVLRRQCQVRGDSQEHHITPISLIPVVLTLVQRKGFKVLFKGMFSIIVLRSVQQGVEEIMSKLTGWPSKLPSTWYINKDWVLHFLLKSTSLVITTPIYSASVINTVRITGDFTNDLNFPMLRQYVFPLTFWQIMIPTATYEVFKYAFTRATFSFSAALLYLNHCFDETERDGCQRVEGGIKFEDRQDICLKASVVAYLSADIVFYPLETVVHRLILQGQQAFTNNLDCGSAAVQIISAHDGFLDCFDNIVWLEGKLGLYKGFGAFLMQAFLYHYCVKFASCFWHYLRMYRRTFSISSS